VSCGGVERFVYSLVYEARSERKMSLNMYIPDLFQHVIKVHYGTPYSESQNTEGPEI
jgi:hypothetical protein